MKLKIKRKTIMPVFLLGSILTIWGIIIWSRSNFNIGYPCTVLLGILIVIYSRYHKKIESFLPKWIKNIIRLICITGVIWSMFLFIYGLNDTTDHKEDAVIILGAALNGDKLSLNLKNRLDKALDYIKQNPNAVIVVSGGQGRGEMMPESLAMKRYLLSHGINENKVFEENKSNSTIENFKFSKKILDEYFDKDYSVAYITTDFHSFRAKMIAQKEGYPNINKCSSMLHWYMYPMTYIRETLACISTFVFYTK